MGRCGSSGKRVFGDRHHILQVPATLRLDPRSRPSERVESQGVQKVMEMTMKAGCTPIALADLALLQATCREVRFEAGDVLRHKGQHYKDMYVITDGCVDVERAPSCGAADLVVASAGSPIGEIGFLRGSPATATVTAQTATGALVIDDP